MGLKRPADQMNMTMSMVGGINQNMVARHIALTQAANNVASMVNQTNQQPAKKQKTPKKRKKKDPNEPHK